MELKLKSIGFSILVTTYICVTILFGQISGEALRLPDQQSSVPQQQSINNVQQIYSQQQQQPQPGVGEGRSSILDLFGLGGNNDPYLARTSSNCLGGDLSECFKNQALSTFDEIFYRNSYQ